MEDNLNDPSSKRIKQKIQTYLKIRHPANHPVLLLYSCQDSGSYFRGQYHHLCRGDSDYIISPLSFTSLYPVILPKQFLFSHG